MSDSHENDLWAERRGGRPPAEGPASPSDAAGRQSPGPAERHRPRPAVHRPDTAVPF
jgi:hypothetical protein